MALFSWIVIGICMYVLICIVWRVALQTPFCDQKRNRSSSMPSQVLVKCDVVPPRSRHWHRTRRPFRRRPSVHLWCRGSSVAVLTAPLVIVLLGSVRWLPVWRICEWKSTLIKYRIETSPIESHLMAYFSSSRNFFERLLPVMLYPGLKNCEFSSFLMLIIRGELFTLGFPSSVSSSAFVSVAPKTDWNGVRDEKWLGILSKDDKFVHLPPFYHSQFNLEYK